MPVFELLTLEELTVLDKAFAVVPDECLSEKAGLLLMRRGILPADIIRLPRDGFAPTEGDRPAQVAGPRRNAREPETTLLPEETAAAVARVLDSHEDPLILPDMTAERLAHLLADRLLAAGLPQVSANTLRTSVMLSALSREAE